MIWQATASPRLGVQAAAILTQIDQGDAQLVIPVIVVAELLFAIERRQLPIDLNGLLQRWQANPAIEIVPLSLGAVWLLVSIPQAG